MIPLLTQSIALALGGVGYPSPLFALRGRAVVGLGGGCATAADRKTSSATIVDACTAPAVAVVPKEIDDLQGFWFGDYIAEDPITSWPTCDNSHAFEGAAALGELGGRRAALFDGAQSMVESESADFMHDGTGGTLFLVGSFAGGELLSTADGSTGSVGFKLSHNVAGVLELSISHGAAPLLVSTDTTAGSAPQDQAMIVIVRVSATEARIWIDGVDVTTTPAFAAAPSVAAASDALTLADAATARLGAVGLYNRYITDDEATALTAWARKYYDF